MHRTMRAGAAVAALSLLAACVHAPAPAYQPGLDNLRTLRAGTSLIAVEDFAAADGVNDSRLSMRGVNSMTGAGGDNAFSSYLQQALEIELRNAGRFDADSGLRLSGTLTVNQLESADLSIGRATVAARFVLTRGGRVVYDQVHKARHEWESSFLGALAVPAAMQGYSATVQKLVGVLFADPAFIAASR